MEDPESKSLASDFELEIRPIKVCFVDCRPVKKSLSMRDFTKIVSALLGLQIIATTGIVFMRPHWSLPIGRWFSIMSTVPTALMYIIAYFNILSGPWGSENSRFWCDVRIMYVRGFNTIRSITTMLTTAMLFILVSMLLGQTDPMAFSLLFILGILIEWQQGISENNNQYDIKSFDRFRNEGDLCMETVHQYQLQGQTSDVHWSAFAISVAIRMYTLTCIVCTAGKMPEIVFGTPLIVIIVFYSCIVPIGLNFVRLKSLITFCQLELYRACADVVCLVLVTAFSLV